MALAMGTMLSEAATMRILIAEDDFASRILLQAVLVKWGYEVVAANDGEVAWTVLQGETAPPIAIVDWMMPGLSGVDLCARVRSQARELVPYILMLTAKGQKEDISQGLDSGADDYLVKPFDLAELGARLRVARRAIALQRELVESRKAIQYQALHDLTTGALNRGSILSALSEAVSAEKPLSIMLIAIDGHKALQQREGAASAEAAVAGVVQRVRTSAPEALIGRYGADELLVLSIGTGLNDATTMADDIRGAVASPTFPESTGLETNVTISLGIAEWDGSAGAELLLCYADAALYAARSIGNTIDVFGLAVGEAQSAE